jgi:non-heme chloroperoxidase
MFFQGLDDMQAAHFNALLVPESPLRVYEATRWSLGVDATKLTAPILIVSGAEGSGVARQRAAFPQNA